MKVSVAMCTYCGAPFVREQLASIATQVRLPDELVVCDDRSSDATRDIIREFARHAPFPVSLHTNDQVLGVVKNFEKAIELCVADIVVLCDQDDVWLPMKLQRTGEAFAACPEAAVVFSNAYLTDESLRPMGTFLWERVNFGPRERRMVQQDKAFGLLLNRDVVTGATMALRSKMKDLILPMPNRSRRLHDALIALMVAAIGKLQFIEEPLIKYRQHPRQRVGVLSRKRSWYDRLSGDLRASTEAHRLAGDELELIRERLLAYSNGSLRADVLTQLEAYITHLRARADMPSGRRRRVAVIARELFALRYQQCSLGLRSAAMDLLLQADR